MVKSALSLSKNLIISRMQQKDLAQIRPHQRGPLSWRNLSRLTLDPFFDPLPINIGLTLSLVGGTIFDAEVKRHFFGQDIEESLRTLDFAQSMKAVERLEMTTPLFYQLAYQVAFEEMFGIAHQPGIARLRSLALEFARIYHHLMTFKNLFFCLKLDDLGELAQHIESQIAQPAEIWFRIYPAEKGIKNVMAYQELDVFLDELILDFRDLEIQAREDKKIKTALLNKGILSAIAAASYGLTGPFLHANGITYDPYRQPGGPIDYPSAPTLWLEDSGDAYARFLVRLMDCRASFVWLRERLQQNARDGIELAPLTYPKDPKAKSPQKLYACGKVSSPEGDAVASLFFNQTDDTITFSLRTPAFLIAQAIPHLLYNLDLSDIPVVLYSLGITAEEIDK